MAAVLGLVVVATFGAGILLAPIPFALTVLARRRTPNPSGVVLWLGTALNVWCLGMFAVSVAIIAYDSLIA